MNAKNFSVAICVEATIYLSLRYLHDCTFNILFNMFQQGPDQIFSVT